MINLRWKAELGSIRIGKSQKPLAKIHGISCFLAPQLNRNTWCPRTPGQSGFMFVGLGTESDWFTSPESSYPLFVGMGKSKFAYCGTYSAVRVEGLSVEEWKSLPDSVSTYTSFSSGSNIDHNLMSRRAKHTLILRRRKVDMSPRTSSDSSRN